MNNNLTKIEKIVIIVTVVAVFMVFGGIGYAFFTMNNNTGSTAEITNTSGKMTITYADGGNNLLFSDRITPSNEIIVDKTFTLTGKNTATAGTGLKMAYEVGLKYSSSFSDGMIHYYIKKVSSTSSSITTEFVGETNQTILGHTSETGYTHGTLIKDAIYQKLVTGEFPATTTDQTVTFNLKLQFPDNGQNQDSEKGKNINAYIEVNHDYSAGNHIADLYEMRDKDADGITIDGLQKDGTGSINQKLLNNSNKGYNATLLNNTLADIEFDSYDNIRFTGAKPNNYIKFNNETWRIIGLFNVYNSKINKNEYLIKIVRGTSLGNYSWDTSASSINSGSGINEWTNSKLYNELNNNYLGTAEGTTTWYNGKNEQQTGTYDYNKNIKDEYVEKIAEVRWNLGGLTSVITSAATFYEEERGTNHVSNPSDERERTNTYSDKIGLMYPSDYRYASSDTKCREASSLQYCRNNNWLLNYASFWTLTSYTDNGYNAIKFMYNPQQPTSVFVTNDTSTANPVYPTLYLKQSVKITGGTGTESDPYTID